MKECAGTVVIIDIEKVTLDEEIKRMHVRMSKVKVALSSKINLVLELKFTVKLVYHGS